jgi:alanine racemase
VAKIVLMSHFARADELHSARTEQVAVFEAARQGLTAEVSLRNSPAVTRLAADPGDWVRPGIMLYGATPFEEANAIADRLQPVMTLESKVICVRELPAGEPVGYGAKFVTDKPMRIGVVAMGYADGYPRQAPTGTPVMVAGQTQPAAGPGVDGHAVRRPDRCAGAGLGFDCRVVGQKHPRQRRGQWRRHHPVPDFLQPASGAKALFRGLRRSSPGWAYPAWSLSASGLNLVKCCKY